VVCVVGEMGNQQQAQGDLAHAAMVIRTNFEGPALLLGALAERFAARGHGSIVGVSSVAGDRGRGSNYVYGAAKAGFSAFLSGLRNRLSASGVHVTTVKPGFVRTRMTQGMKLPPLLTAEPGEVGAAILATVRGKPKDVLYVRKLWRPVMMAIGAIPEPIFKKMRL
jgi:NAD(P)-dependent dehydrogenase (short-subunit alcohol dehydrogenase family)